MVDFVVAFARFQVLLPAFPAGNGGGYLGGNPVTRVAVFIDYENSRFGAREVFGDPRRDPYTFGHVAAEAGLLKQLGEQVDPTRELTAVYRLPREAGPKERSAGTSRVRKTVRLVGASSARKGQKPPTALPTDGMVNGPADSVAG